jgi:hypothetical protein
MTRLLATILLLLMMAFEAGPARAAEAAQAGEEKSTYEFLGVPLTQKRIAIGAAALVGLGVAGIAAIVAESFAIGAGTGFITTFALFEFLTLPVEAGVAAYLWPEEDEGETMELPFRAEELPGEAAGRSATP